MNTGELLLAADAGAHVGLGWAALLLQTTSNIPRQRRLGACFPREAVANGLLHAARLWPTGAVW